MTAPKVVPLTKQQAFDLSVNGIRAQGYRRSVAADSPSCMYRGPDGLKCTVGHMIPDELYAPALENSSAYMFNGQNQYAAGPVLPITSLLSGKGVIDVATDLQQLHDAMDAQYFELQARQFEQGFSRIAKERGLLYTPPPPVPSTGI